ncbi:MAG: rRNA pseudouridine synthase [Fimbriimonadaceae bacterium]|nr:rRNA pseudouridine synthase [Fimbriimonadaceae bacterium]
MRLHRYLAQCGIASRRKAEEIILEGRVAVDGKIITELGTKVDEGNVVTLDGARVSLPEHAYFVLNKPKGYVTTLSDDRKRPTVVKFFPSSPAGLKPVGRLDKDSSGLLLISNDGDFAMRLTHPRYGVEKEYEVSVSGVPNERDLGRLERGMTIDGQHMSVDTVTVSYAAPNGNKAVLRMILHEGRNRQIRKMTEFIGHPTTDLTRVRIGHLKLKGMRPGECRRLGNSDIERLLGD